MRALVAAALMGLLAGCGSVASHQPAATSAQPSSIAGASPSPSPFPTARTPPPFPLAPLTHVDFSCRLPVIMAWGFEYSFIDFPSRRQSATSSPGNIYYDPVVDRSSEPMVARRSPVRDHRHSARHEISHPHRRRGNRDRRPGVHDHRYTVLLRARVHH